MTENSTKNEELVYSCQQQEIIAEYLVFLN